MDISVHEDSEHHRAASAVRAVALKRVGAAPRHAARARRFPGEFTSSASASAVWLTPNKRVETRWRTRQGAVPKGSARGGAYRTAHNSSVSSEKIVSARSERTAVVDRWRTGTAMDILVHEDAEHHLAASGTGKNRSKA